MPAFRFRFHDCKHENLELEVMSMALKSSLDCYEYSCSCGHFTSNSIVVTHVSNHQTFIHFAFLVDMVSIYRFAMQWSLVSLIKSLVQWFHTTHKLYDQSFGAISEMLFCFKSYYCWPIVDYEHNGLQIVIWYFDCDVNDLNYHRLYISIWVFCMVLFHSTTRARIGINVYLVSQDTFVYFGETCEHLVLCLPCPAP